ncbi:MAG TPA: lipoyl synthase [Candidatus Omnitrophica bacterium]|nr:lipoyl synthase [Candidatus Omnitrophota bacterium]
MRLARRPAWLNKKIDFDKNRHTSALLKEIGVHTVCKEAKCPNISECFKKAHATFLILGKYCTRKCSFCNVEKLRPQPIDEEEPGKVAEAIKRMGLKHAVITSVTRDDLPDGGARIFARTVELVRRSQPEVTIELLIPDFKNDPAALEAVAKSAPDIIGHNIETVPRLYGLRPGASYARSLSVLRYIKRSNKLINTKSALMLGLGEKKDEVLRVLEDLRCVDCDFVALGQYLRPSLKHTEVVEYILPELFEHYKTEGLKIGFKHIESAPYIRSSFSASSYLEKPKN